MTKKRNIIYIALSLSIGYLLYTYIFTDYGFYMMMNHHYGYYDNFSEMGYYLRSGLVFLSYTVLFISIIMLVLDKTVSKNNPLTILISSIFSISNATLFRKFLCIIIPLL